MTKVAFCFPGQGSQRVGMAAISWRSSRRPRRCSTRRHRTSSASTSAVSASRAPSRSSPRPGDPAGAGGGVARGAGGRSRSGSASCPYVVVGHSVGEYAAIAAADSDQRRPASPGSCASAAWRWRRRGRAARWRRSWGSPTRRSSGCAGETGDVWPANYNSPGQLVISGREHGVDERRREGPRAGREGRARCAVSGAFHSPLVRTRPTGSSRPCAPPTSASCGRAFMSTVSSKLETVDRVPGLLIEQVTAPVRFTQSVQALVGDGVRTFVEVGPGGVLAGPGEADRPVGDGDLGWHARRAARGGGEPCRIVSSTGGSPWSPAARAGSAPRCAQSSAPRAPRSSSTTRARPTGPSRSCAHVRGRAAPRTRSQGDVSTPEGAAGLVAQVESEIGPIAILVCNAGITRDNLIMKLSGRRLARR